MFKVTGGKGFHITFPNGITISTQFGGGNYCDNYDYPITAMLYDSLKQRELEADTPPCPNAEIMIWDNNKKGKKITSELPKKVLGQKPSGETVEGYVELYDWLNILDWCKNYR